MSIIGLANFKGGCGKTTIGHHVAVAASERDRRVLVVDTDRQANLYRRLAGRLDHAEDRPPLAWADGCAAVYSPEEWALPDAAAGTYDLVVVDTPPGVHVPRGPRPNLLLIPIDGIDAALNANETVADALAANVPAIVLVNNGIAEGGRAFARHLREQLGDGLPARVILCDVELPRGPAIKRSAKSCAPAWHDPYKGSDARAIRKLCEWIPDLLT